MNRIKSAINGAKEAFACIIALVAIAALFFVLLVSIGFLSYKLELYLPFWIAALLAGTAVVTFIGALIGFFDRSSVDRQVEKSLHDKIDKDFNDVAIKSYKDLVVATSPVSGITLAPDSDDAFRLEEAAVYKPLVAEDKIPNKLIVARFIVPYSQFRKIKEDYERNKGYLQDTVRSAIRTAINMGIAVDKYDISMQMPGPDRLYFREREDIAGVEFRIRFKRK